jgi:enoyl-CoA hydratase/carnithine racemase
MSIDVVINNRIGFINLNRPKALNSLSLDMIRTITQTLLLWKDDANISSVVIQSAHEKGFCAGGDIRFFTLPDRHRRNKAAHYWKIFLPKNIR